MIKITNKEDCCGCSACISACPKKCISFSQDKEGFQYPYVNVGDCIDCHLCERVCPVINNEVKSVLPIVYGCIGDDPIRMRSSSGGYFTLLAEFVIKKGGVVFGARFESLACNT